MSWQYMTPEMVQPAKGKRVLRPPSLGFGWRVSSRVNRADYPYIMKAVRNEPL